MLDQLTVNDLEAQRISNTLRDILAERAHFTGHCDSDHDAPPRRMPASGMPSSVVTGLLEPAGRTMSDSVPVGVQAQDRCVDNPSQRRPIWPASASRRRRLPASWRADP